MLFRSGVDNVLDADRQPGEQPWPPGLVGGARLRQRVLGIEMDPHLDRGALLDAVETVAGELLRGQRARL